MEERYEVWLVGVWRRERTWELDILDAKNGLKYELQRSGLKDVTVQVWPSKVTRRAMGESGYEDGKFQIDATVMARSKDEAILMVKDAVQQQIFEGLFCRAPEFEYV